MIDITRLYLIGTWTSLLVAVASAPCVAWACWACCLKNSEAETLLGDDASEGE